MNAQHGLITIVHTSFVAVPGLVELFAELAPKITLRHIVDDSLLHEVLSNGCVTPRVQERIGIYLAAAEQMGSDVIFSQCSSVGEAVEQESVEFSTPVVRIDARFLGEPMSCKHSNVWRDACFDSF